MKLRFFPACAIAVCALWAGGVVTTAQNEQPAKQAEAPKVSSGERSAAEKIDKAKGPEAKLQAGAEFIKKYPQSALRPQVAEVLANEIGNTTDAQLRTSLAETYATIFTGPGEAERLTPLLFDAHIAAGRAEDAFRVGGQLLARNPEDANILYRLAVIASNETIKGNNAFAAQGRQYGVKAVELIEGDKMPAGQDPAAWATFKADALPTLYRAIGIIAFKTEDTAAARQYLEKAIAHKTTDPGVYLLMANLVYDEYELTAKQSRVATGAEQEALREKATQQLDRVIEAYAQAIAVAEGNPQYQQAVASLRENLTTYYKFRHNNSTDGLQQLIDKYKKQ